MAALAVMVMMLVLLVIVMAALAMVMMMLMLFVIVAVALFAVFMMVVMLVSLLSKLVHFCLKGGFSFHSLKQLRARKLFPRSGNDNSRCVMLLKKSHTIRDLLIGNISGVAEDDATCIRNLIVEKFAEILHMHLAFVRVNNGGKAVKLSTFGVGILNRLDNVGKLAYARGLDKNAIGGIFSDNLLERLSKIANQRAADTSRIHFVYLYACLGKKAAVNTDLTEFIFDKNDFFTLVRFFNKLLYKSGLSCTEKARENVNFSHLYLPSFK
jgi:hypothetical protein